MGHRVDRADGLSGDIAEYKAAAIGPSTKDPDFGAASVHLNCLNEIVISPMVRAVKRWMEHIGCLRNALFLLVSSFLLSLLVWLFYTGPLPAHVTEAVPWSAHHFKGGATVNATEPCDQLQFLYHYWLLSDMLTGDTPWMHNLYELNFGPNPDTYRPDTYYIPFSLVFAVGKWLVNQPFGMNLAGFMSIWMSALMTALLVRRYGASGPLLLLAMVVALIVPYRWHTLLGGSPTGPGLAMVPLVYWGMDRAVRNRCWWGGLAAGLGVFLACASDTHVFVFVVFTVPCWCILALLNREGFRWNVLSEWLKQIPPLLPAALGLGAAMWVSTHLGATLEDAVHVEGRTIDEVRIYSPLKAGLFSWDYMAMSNLIYVGYVLPILLVIGGLSLLFKARRAGLSTRALWQPLVTALLLGLGMIMVVLLGLGTNGPPEGLWTDIARSVLPKYNMIRQTSKIFCLLPTLMAVAVVVVLPFVLGRNKSWQWIACIAISLAAGWEYRQQLNPAVMVLDAGQGAYKAVADDAAAQGKPPRALVAVFWPGDSHETAVYQYYSSLYRIRMVNGYTPFIGRDYMDNVFHKFESVNQGWLTPAQIDSLLANGIDYLLLHEDRFPEKVSPFPVGFTLRNLLNNPRIEFMAREHEVWSFRLLQQARADAATVSPPLSLLPARRWETERLEVANCLTVADDAASGGEYRNLNATNAWIQSETHWIVPPATSCVCWLRLKGYGVVETRWEDASTQTIARAEVSVDTNSWTWMRVPVPEVAAYTPATFRVKNQSGRVGVDLIMLGTGRWTDELKTGDVVRLNAADFFRAGHTDIASNTIVMEKGRRSGVMFYGPKLPLLPGRYAAALDYVSEAQIGEKLGELHVSLNDERALGNVDVVAGQAVQIEWQQPDNRPFNLVFVFTGVADLELQTVVLNRLE